jgi:hypothetical protein
MKTVIVCTMLLMAITSCSTNTGVRIESTPTGATLSSIGPTGEKTTLGKTPLQISEQDFFRNEKIIELQASMAGHRESIIIVPRTERLKELSLTIKLKEQVTSEAKNSDRLNFLVGDLAQAQAMIHQKKLVQAEAILQKLSREFPDLAVVRDLLGNAVYLNGRSQEALEIYLKAEALDPGNNGRKTIIKKIQGQ